MLNDKMKGEHSEILAANSYSPRTSTDSLGFGQLVRLLQGSCGQIVVWRSEEISINGPNEADQIISRGRGSLEGLCLYPAH